MTSYTRSGARRSGDEYQDLQSAEVLVGWLEQPDAYRWVRLEAMDGSLDDIQAECADGTHLLLQVKFGTDPTVEWTWDELTRQEIGKTGPKPSLVQKWHASLNDVLAKGVTVREAALLTNRTASTAIRAHLLDSGLVDFDSLPTFLRKTIAAQLGGPEAVSNFFAAFHFFFKERSLEVMETSLRLRFHLLGGAGEGWASLMGKIRRWINRKDEPNPDGTITLTDVRIAALWHLPPLIPQGFLIPDDYVAPADWSREAVELRLRASGDRLVVVTGSPGVGKSTYLSWLVNLLHKADVPVVRHHYFLSLTDTTPHRTAWETAADAIIGQLRSSYGKPVQTTDGQNPLPEKLREFLVAAGRERAGKDPLVVIVDGLDHVWRDTGSEEGLRRLFDLLLPTPDGVVVVVGTQSIDITRIPRKLRDLCPRDRWLEVPVLDGEGVHEWLKYHEHELGLPEDKNHANRVFGELADAFRYVSGGHPLILHYILGEAQRGGPLIRPDTVRARPRFDSNSNVASYYQKLWDDISPEGHELLNLLAGFPWAWPRDGLVQCLALQADHARLEQAERAIRHVLGTSPAGVTAFHESLLAFIRALPDHQTAAQSLRPRVVDWLTHHSPEYWRWRHEWEERARNGDIEDLISSATLDWCVHSLTAGRSRKEIAEVVAASGLAALKTGRLGVATERHYIDAYLEDTGLAEDVLSKLVWLSLHDRDPSCRELELNLFLSRKAQATEEEIEAVADVAFSAGRLDVCQELLDECCERWDAAIRRGDRIEDSFSSLKECLPSLIATSLTIPSEGPYQRYVSKHDDEPDWCSHRYYAKAIARLCAVGDDTHAIREELRFLANHAERVSFEAVDEIVRLACREGFDPDRWIQNPESRRSGLFRCHRVWLKRTVEMSDKPPQEVSFQSVWNDRFGSPDKRAFIELACTYFFSCLACAVEDRKPTEPVGLDPKASKAAMFLSMLRDLAAEAAASKAAGHAVGGAWLVARLASINPPELKPYDFDNRPVEPVSVAWIVVAIAQDLEELHHAETGGTTLTRDVVKAAIDSNWTWARIWIEDRVERRLTMGDCQAAEFLIEREQIRLEGSRASLHTRAEEYASLAQFCQLHLRPMNEVHYLACLAARNLLGHGYHKDIILFDVLAAIRAAHGKSKESTLARLRSISPIVQVVDEITDGRETNHLKIELAGIVGDLLPEALPPYLRMLQYNHHHRDVEACFTNVARSSSFRTVYERALATTLVHEEALTALQDRAEGGDFDAKSVLDNTLAYCGRQAAAPKKSDTGSTGLPKTSEKSPPSVEDYPPERLTEFVQAVRDADIYGGEHLAAWTTYWQSRDPDGLLAALTAYRAAYDHPHETKTAKVVVELAFERSGRGSAWDWLIAYHKALSGWSSGYWPSEVGWIWEYVRSRFSDRWLEFITATSRSRWGVEGGAPSWSIQRMVIFLKAVGQDDRVDEVIDAAVRWGAGLAADMRLPDSALTPDKPDLPVALRLLIDRLDCPSRMVQERAASSLAGLLADPNTWDATTRAMLDWHAVEPLELRSCTLLLTLHLARTTYSVSAGDCVDIARQANLVPSIGVDLLLRELGDDGATLAAVLDYRKRHSGRPAACFSGVEDFGLTVGAHLAPIFRTWASTLDESGISFSRQWEWEAVRLAHQQGLSLRLNAHFDYHYRGGVDGPALAINDRLSVVLRSAFLRALHWAIDKASLDINWAEINARKVAVLADPAFWAVRPSDRPDWWPADSGNADGLDTLGEAVGQAVRNRLEKWPPDEGEVLLYAAGPVGNRPRFRAEVVIRAFLQSAYGPLKPSTEDLTKIPWVGCKPKPPRLSLPGTYETFEEYAGMIRDWLVAPLAWWIHPDTNDWLLPQRQVCGLHMPATWLLPSAPSIHTEPGQILITIGEQHVARYRYWHDELRERHYLGTGSRAGGELLIHRKWLEPQLAAGASLCWVATLRISQREEYKEEFGEPQVVGTWAFGGSHLVWPKPWQPPPLGSP